MFCHDNLIFDTNGLFTIIMKFKDNFMDFRDEQIRAPLISNN